MMVHCQTGLGLYLCNDSLCCLQHSLQTIWYVVLSLHLCCHWTCIWKKTSISQNVRVFTLALYKKASAHWGQGAVDWSMVQIEHLLLLQPSRQRQQFSWTRSTSKRRVNVDLCFDGMSCNLLIFMLNLKYLKHLTMISSEPDDCAKVLLFLLNKKPM